MVISLIFRERLWQGQRRWPTPDEVGSISNWINPPDPAVPSRGDDR